mgnify:FL=1
MHRIHEYLVGATIFLLPFLYSLGMSQGRGFLGGMGQDASFYPVFLGMLIWTVELFLGGKIFFPKSLSFYFSLVFLSLLVLSGIVNLGNIINAEFYGQTGIFRYVVQTGTMFLYFFGTLYFYNFFRNYQGDIYRFVGKLLLASFVLSATYSCLEVGSFVSEFVASLLLSVDQLFRGANTESVYGWRLRSLAFEASLFGTYISAVFPWILLAALRRGKTYILLLFICIGMVALSFSRTPYGVCAVQFILLLLFLKGNLIKTYGKALIGISSVVIIIAYAVEIFLGGIFTTDDMINTVSALWTFDSAVKETSNLTRFGSQVAAWNVFLENPFCGIGWGQGALCLVDYYPYWAWDSIEIREYFQYNPSIFGVHPRILAELGILGMMTWLLLWGGAIANIYRRFKRQGNEYDVVLMISIIGVLLSGFNMDMFHFWAYWIFLGVAWALETKQGRC